VNPIPKRALVGWRWQGIPVRLFTYSPIPYMGEMEREREREREEGERGQIFG